MPAVITKDPKVTFILHRRRFNSRIPVAAGNLMDGPVSRVYAHIAGRAIKSPGVPTPQGSFAKGFYEYDLLAGDWTLFESPSCTRMSTV